MTLKNNILTIGIVGIILIDTIGSIASRVFSFNYIYIGPFSIFIYGFVGFIAARERNLKQAIISTFILGLFDSTVGWLIMNLLEANVGGKNMEIHSLFGLFIMIFLVVFIASLMGLIGGGIGLLFKRKTAND